MEAYNHELVLVFTFPAPVLHLNQKHLYRRSHELPKLTLRNELHNKKRGNSEITRSETMEREQSPCWREKKETQQKTLWGHFHHEWM